MLRLLEIAVSYHNRLDPIAVVLAILRLPCQHGAAMCPAAVSNRLLALLHGGVHVRAGVRAQLWYTCGVELLLLAVSDTL